MCEGVIVIDSLTNAATEPSCKRLYLLCMTSSISAELLVSLNKFFVMVLKAPSHIIIHCRDKGDDNQEKEVMNSWSSKQASNEEEEKRTELQEQLYNELHPRRKPLHVFFILISILTALSALNMGIGQFLGIAFAQVGPIQYVMRIYVILLCVLTILNELEWPSFVRESTILSWWVTRGAFYCFIGVLGLEENDVDIYKVNGRNAALGYIKVVAWLMIGCGILYFVMGVVCLQFVLKRMREDYKQRCERAKEARRMTETYMTDRAV